MAATTLHIPTIHTERLTLRCPAMEDLDAYAAFRASDRAVHVGGPHPRYESFEKLCSLVGHWHMHGYGRWMVTDTSDGTPLGVVGLYYPDDWPEPEIAWSVFEAGEGRGIAYEAACATRAFAYDVLGWTRVISCVAPDNTRSVALAKRMGAVIEYTHNVDAIGPLDVWRHLSPEELKK